MTHRLTLSPRRARVLRWCERQVDGDLVSVWSEEDKQTLLALLADGLAVAQGPRYVLTPDGAKALLCDPGSYLHAADLDILDTLPTEAQWDAMMRAPDFPPSDPEE